MGYFDYVDADISYALRLINRELGTKKDTLKNSKLSIAEENVLRRQIGFLESAIFKIRTARY